MSLFGGQMSESIIVLVRDLMFASRISATAKSLSVPVVMLRDPQALAQEDGIALIVDLNQSGALDAAAEWKARTHGVVMGFTAHIDSDTIARAQSLGIDRVLARSAFVQQLPQLLSNQASNDADKSRE
jgi:hypothetical protein